MDWDIKHQHELWLFETSNILGNLSLGRCITVLLKEKTHVDPKLEMIYYISLNNVPL